MYLTFDVGTTSVKTAIYNREGNLVYKAIKEYQLEAPKTDWYEVDPEVYWNAVIEGFKEVIEKSKIDPHEIVTISGCSQGETIVLLDKADKPLRPAIVWIDNRARSEVKELSKLINENEFYQVTGLVEMEPTWSIFKILWIKNHEPEVFKQIDKILLVEDYIIYRLTGEFVSSSSILTSTGLIDIHKKRYWGKTVGYAGIQNKLPKIIDEGAIVGRVKKDISELIGISEKVNVVKGSMDQTASAIGSGNIKPGIVTETTGTAMVVAVTIKKAVYKSGVKLPFQPHVVENQYLLLPYAQTAGIVYKWFRDEFAKDLLDKYENREMVYNALNTVVKSVEPGSDGLVLLPFFAGASFPENDSHAKGVFYGITLKHTRAHFIRAIMESIGYMLKKILKYINDYGIEIKEIHSMGGAARSDIWLQIKSDICGINFIRMKEEETSTLGAAIIAAVSVGDYKTFEEAVDSMVKKGKIFAPNQLNYEKYENNFLIYNELYSSLKELFRKG